MKRGYHVNSILCFVGAIAVGVACFFGVPLSDWKSVFSGLLVAISMFGAATLVRLARPAPITAPATFDDADLKRFFDTLETLSGRLFWLFIQLIIGVVIVLVSIWLCENEQHLDVRFKFVTSISSGALGFIITWLIMRLVSMVRGDIGFLRLQRQILENALMRERKKAAEKIASSRSVELVTGKYGRVIGQ
jgi:uncharacterized membrane protein YiaA